MRVTRRNVLIVLGILTVAGGTVFGAGAFSQVQADRTVTAQTAGDGSAYLQLDGDGSYVSDASGDGAIEFQFDSLNENATSTFEGVLNVSANPADDSGPYDLYVQSDTGLGSDAVMDVRVSGGSTIVGSGQATTLDPTATEPVQLTIEFDTNAGDPGDLPENITIVATEQ